MAHVTHRVAVVGGGMAGLAAAYELENRRQAGSPLDWVLIEKDDRLGGKVRTVREEGFVIEGGPDSFIIEKPWPIELARKVGVYDRLLNSNDEIRKSFIYSRGRLHELPEGLILMVPTRLVPFALSSLISWPGKLRMGLDLVLPRGPGGDESLGNFVRRRLGREALEKIAEPLVAGIHAGDPEQMSVQSTFPMFIDMEQKYRSLVLGMVMRRRARARAQTTPAASAPAGAAPSPAAPKRSYFLTFTTGLADLSDAVIAALSAERLRLGAAVEALARVDGGSLGQAARPPGRAAAAYELRLSDGTTERVDAVVLAAPAFATGALLRDVAPSVAGDLESIAYVTSATVSLAFPRSAVRHPLRGFGYVVPRAEARPVMATTWTSSKFPGRAPEGYVLLRSFVGRAGYERYATVDDDELRRLVLEELRDTLGIDAQPVLTRIFRWPNGMPQYRVGHAALVERIEGGVAALPGIEIAGGAYHGIGIGDCIREGTAAARRVTEYIAGTPEEPVPAQPADLPAADGITD